MQIRGSTLVRTRSEPPLIELNPFQIRGALLSCSGPHRRRRTNSRRRSPTAFRYRLYLSLVLSFSLFSPTLPPRQPSPPALLGSWRNAFVSQTSEAIPLHGLLVVLLLLPQAMALHRPRQPRREIPIHTTQCISSFLLLFQEKGEILITISTTMR